MQLIPVKLTDADLERLQDGYEGRTHIFDTGNGYFMLELGRAPAMTGLNGPARIQERTVQTQLRTQTNEKDLPVIKYLRWDNKCAQCKIAIPKGAMVRWNPDSKPKQIFCNTCKPL